MFAVVTPIATDDGGCSVVANGDCDIPWRCSARIVIIHIILIAIFVFLGGQLEELDQTKTHWR